MQDDDLVGPPIPSDRPPTGSSQIINLIQDVWLRILPLCGIRGVLAIGQVSTILPSRPEAD
jgi:hypothetical protein